jgi:hypothetical protein
MRRDCYIIDEMTIEAETLRHEAHESTHKKMRVLA